MGLLDELVFISIPCCFECTEDIHRTGKCIQRTNAGHLAIDRKQFANIMYLTPTMSLGELVPYTQLRAPNKGPVCAIRLPMHLPSALAMPLVIKSECFGGFARALVN